MNTVCTAVLFKVIFVMICLFCLKWLVIGSPLSCLSIRFLGGGAGYTTMIMKWVWKSIAMTHSNDRLSMERQISQSDQNQRNENALGEHLNTLGSSMEAKV